jgi:hypothetical protein
MLLPVDLTGMGTGLPVMGTKRQRGIIWAAVSTKAQTDDDRLSLPTQIDSGKSFFERENIDLIDTLIVPGHTRKARLLTDLAASAREKGIDAFDRLIAHLDAADFDVIWVRDANRFARRASLLHYIVESVIEDCSARIYAAEGGGWVDETNADFWVTAKGWETSSQSRWIASNMQQAKRSRADRGLPVNNQKCWSHRVVRNPETGKAVLLEPDPDKRAALLAMTDLFLQRLSYNAIESTVFERYGFGEGGKPYYPKMFYSIVWNPIFHGNTGMGYRSGENGQKVGLWAFDPAATRPDGLYIHYGTVEPALPADLLRLVQAELRRRTAIGEQHRPQKPHIFTGLLTCAYCGNALVYDYRPSRTTKARYRCQSKYNRRVVRQCDKAWSIRELDVQHWFDKQFDHAARLGWPELFFNPPDIRIAGQVDELKRQLADIEAQADRLIHKIATAPASLADRFDSQIAALGNQADKLQNRINALEQQVQRQQTDEAGQAWREIQSGNVWERAAGEINQLLHRAMAGKRLVVAGTEIIGVRED